MNLHEFLENKSCRTAWIQFGALDVYVRKAFHNVDGTYAKTFDIANVIARIPNDRGKGAFKSFLAELRAILKYEILAGTVEGIYIENVQQERFREFFRRNGWTEISALEPLGDPCFYMPLYWEI